MCLRWLSCWEFQDWTRDRGVLRRKVPSAERVVGARRRNKRRRGWPEMVMPYGTERVRGGVGWGRETDKKKTKFFCFNSFDCWDCFFLFSKF